MAVTLTVEDGSGAVDSNTYVSLSDAEIYFEARPHASAWTALDDDTKAQMLVMATNVIDREAQSRYDGWLGYPINTTQRLAWPRAWVPVPDPVRLTPIVAYEGGSSAYQYLASDAVPRFLVEATCEQALLTATSDRTLDAEGQGLTSVTVDTISIGFDTSGRTQQKPLGQNVLALILPYVNGMGGIANVVRVA